jgi:D-tyrosyl-tRNA(Tyr) deacylase
MVLCGITHTDNQIDIDYLVPKLLKTKLFGAEDGEGWKQSVVEKGAQILLVSQFTLYH